MRFTLKFEIINKPLTTREKKNKRNLEAYHKRMQDPVKREKDRKRNRDRYKKTKEDWILY